MFIEPTQHFVSTIRDFRKPRIELDDLEAVVHTCQEQVTPAAFGWVPFYTPDTAPDVGLLERSNGLPYVKEANIFVITERISRGA